MTKWKGWKAVLRDVVIIWALTAIGGFIVGIASAKPRIVSIGLSNILLGSIGFCISGCMAKDNRWKHLSIVSIFVWFASIINIIFLQSSFKNWVFGIFIIFIMMAIGGGLSFLFVKSSRSDMDTETIS